MCGIVGILGDKLSATDLKVFTDLLEADQIRGRHSTGVIAVDDSQVYYHKRAVQGSDFVQLAKTKEIIFKAANLLIGHNRYATRGGISDETAHPFIEGTVHMVHNGTITNQYQLIPTSTGMVDSNVIARALSQTGNDHKSVIALLEKIEGAYCIVWFDTRDNKVKFARNDERPLGLRVTTDERLVWSSDGALADAMLSHAGKKIKKRYELAVGKLMCIDVDTLKADNHKFTPAPNLPVYQGYTHYGSGRGAGARSSGTGTGTTEGTPAKKPSCTKSPIETGCTDPDLKKQFPVGKLVKFYATNVFPGDDDDEVECWCVDADTNTTDIVAQVPAATGAVGCLYQGRVQGYTEMWTDNWVVDINDAVPLKQAATPVECAWCCEEIQIGEATEAVGYEALHKDCYATYLASVN